jgi:ketosteroid isomerase-like protein
LAIEKEDFDTLMNYYTDDAILIVQPEMIIFEAGDTALVISQTLLAAEKRIRNILWIEWQHMCLRKIHTANGFCNR